MTEGWIDDFKSSVDASPNAGPYYWTSTPETLISSSQPIQFSLGTGSQILSSTFLRCASTDHELIITTCFWAKSRSQEDLSSLLLKLSSKALSRGRKIQVRICFSSCSISQKLFQTSSLDGKFYPPSTWVGLGLPSPENLTGLELVVKSIFVRPFSVMHPKFILVDRRTAYMPSCNVSWEDWFEGCVEMNGEISEKLFDFWRYFWSRGEAELPDLPPVTSNSAPALDGSDSSMIKQISFPLSMSRTQTILLPSPHHINPTFRPFFLSAPAPPPTPLNLFLLHLFNTSKTDIFIQTPNLTSYPVISALISALGRGINVQIITSSRLMILEQLITAGTITEFEIWKLCRKHQSLLEHYQKTLRNTDPENLMEKPGMLNISYFIAGEGKGEPVKSHLKLVIVDGEVTVLGSGNMDRASWYTSQELNVAFFSEEIAREVRAAVGDALNGRVRVVY